MIIARTVIFLHTREHRTPTTLSYGCRAIFSAHLIKCLQMQLFSECGDYTSNILDYGQKTLQTIFLTYRSLISADLADLSKFEKSRFLAFFWPPPPAHRQAKMALKSHFLSGKMRLSSRVRVGRPNLFGGETTLVRCVFWPSGIVVKVQ